MAAGVSLFGVDNELGMSGALLVCALAAGRGGLVFSQDFTALHAGCLLGHHQV